MVVYRRGVLVAAVVGVSLVLSGCVESVSEPVPVQTVALPTPTPTPTVVPQKPALSELVLSADGLGELRIGEKPPTDDPRVNIANYDPNACPEDPDDTSLWSATYPDREENDGYFGPGNPFTMTTYPADAVTRIDVHSAKISTDRGIHLGSTFDELLAAYPEGPDEIVDDRETIVLHAYYGEFGKLLVEVTLTDTTWGSSGIDGNTVVVLRVVELNSSTVAVSGTDDAIGQCRFPI